MKRERRRRRTEEGEGCGGGGVKRGGVRARGGGGGQSLRRSWSFLPPYAVFRPTGGREGELDLRDPPPQVLPLPTSNWRSHWAGNTMN